jgi:hypothetical protein
MDVHHERPAGVGDVGHVDLAARELPDQPSVDRPEQEVAVLGLPAGALDVVQDPVDLGPREIRVDEQARLAADRFLQAAFL